MEIEEDGKEKCFLGNTGAGLLAGSDRLREL
jgi:hypothetical protein